MKSVTSFIHKMFIIIVFEIHTPTAALQCFSVAVLYMDLLLRVSRKFFQDAAVPTQTNETMLDPSGLLISPTQSSLFDHSQHSQ